MRSFVIATLSAGAILGAVSAADAMPLGTSGAVAESGITNVAFGCGPGFIPRRFGPGCRPIGGFRRPFVARPYFRRGPYRRF